MTDAQKELTIGLLLEARELLKATGEDYDPERALDWMARAADLVDYLQGMEAGNDLG